MLHKEKAQFLGHILQSKSQHVQQVFKVQIHLKPRPPRSPTITPKKGEILTTPKPKIALKCWQRYSGCKGTESALGEFHSPSVN